MQGVHRPSGGRQAARKGRYDQSGVFVHGHLFRAFCIVLRRPQGDGRSPPIAANTAALRRYPPDLKFSDFHFLGAQKLTSKRRSHGQGVTISTAGGIVPQVADMNRGRWIMHLDRIAMQNRQKCIVIITGNRPNQASQVPERRLKQIEVYEWHRHLPADIHA